ncbi:MAG: hypothetical protein P8Y91_00015 [Desulfuromonadales bacterium]|jgi:hypothetical protein
MFQIVEKQVQLALPQRHHLHCMICQVPNRLGPVDYACKLSDPGHKWQQIRSILALVAKGEGNLKKLHFLVFPEAALPYRVLPETLEFIDQQFAANTVTIIGIEHIDLLTYIDLLERFAADNQEVLASVRKDREAGDIDGAPVNCCLTIIKENDGVLRVFIQAKSHPFFGEETIDPFHDLYRGKVFPLVRCQPTGYNFMSLICLDYIYRDLYQSNISTVIDKANELFHQTRQRLDLLCVIECNPKPEHQAFRDVVNGFYGEYLAYTPGVRETTTVFCNSSEESTGLGDNPAFTFGRSMVIMHRSHKIAAAQTRDFDTDDFDGLPVCRLLFGTATRLYYFNLPLFHELDPRTTRFPLKIHAIYQPDGKSWQRSGPIPGRQGLDDHDFAAARRLDAAAFSERTVKDHE